MGLFSFIGGLFASSPKDAMDITKGVGGFIDNAFYTDQEKAAASLKVLDYHLKWLNATRGMNVARRLIALSFVFVFLSVFALSVTLVVVGWALGLDVGAVVGDVVKLVEVFRVGWVTVTVVVFYFGKGIVEQVSGKRASGKV